MTTWIAIIVGGFIAGSMNALAGYGSIITLTILMELIGLPGHIANGTNRINVITNTFGGMVGFHKNGKLKWQEGKPIILWTCLGAILGIIVATQVNNEQFRFVFKYLIVILLFIILLNPKRWLHDVSQPHDLSWWKLALVFFPIGFYGGFIQMGMGLFFLAGSVLIAKFNMLEANAIKLVTVTLYTLISLVIFQWRGMVDWPVGLSLGAATFAGGYLTANYASRYKSANLWTYRLLVVIIIFVLLKTFEIISI